MNEDLEQIVFTEKFNHFAVEWTKDNSPTLRLMNQERKGENNLLESMHHSEGAASETHYIYTQPFIHFIECFKKKSFAKMNVAVVGLGLGYIEFSFLYYLLTHPLEKHELSISSFEKESELIHSLQEWIRKDQNISSINSANSLYDIVFSSLCEKTVSVSEFKKFIRNCYYQPENPLQWVLLSELHKKTSTKVTFHFVAFDAFSAATEQSLWSDDFLDFFLTHLCSSDCVFVTYACTGHLKRALKRNQFILIRRLGFAQKRESTLAVRGLFTEAFNVFSNKR
jgi:hypothetical protein